VWPKPRCLSAPPHSTVGDATSPGETIATGTRRDFAWGFVAQAFSSATNFALAVVAGRLLGPAGLGVVVVGFGAYQLVAGLQRAIVMQPLIADAAPRPAIERRRLADSGLAIVACSGIVATFVVAVVGVGVAGDVGRGLLIIAPWLAAALLQEFWKAILFQERRGAVGAASDCVRFSVMAVSIPVALVWKHDYVVVGGWGLGAAAGLAVGFACFPGRPQRLHAAFSVWRERAWGLGRWLAAREIVFQLFAYATVLILAVILGANGLGGLRAAEALFSPFSLVAAALVLPALPALSRATASSHRGALQLAFRICAVAVGFGLIYMVLMALIGPWLLVRLFGERFSRFTDLVWPMAAVQLLNAAGVSFTLLLMAEKRGRASLVAGIAASAATLACATGLSLRYGVQGAAWGMAAGSGVGSVTVIYLAVRRRVSSGETRLIS
jgi:O-antigen/teichoic acid export membrane protein